MTFLTKTIIMKKSKLSLAIKMANILTGVLNTATADINNAITEGNTKLESFDWNGHFIVTGSNVLEMLGLLRPNRPIDDIDLAIHVKSSEEASRIDGIIKEWYHKTQLLSPRFKGVYPNDKLLLTQLYMSGIKIDILYYLTEPDVFWVDNQAMMKPMRIFQAKEEIAIRSNGGPHFHKSMSDINYMTRSFSNIETRVFKGMKAESDRRAAEVEEILHRQEDIKQAGNET